VIKQTILASILSKPYLRKFLTVLCASTMMTVLPTHISFAQANDKAPVDFVADNLMHDDENQKIIATGNVELAQSGRVVTADEITYDLLSDKVIAKGNIAMTDEDGNVYFADYLDLNDSFKDGFADKIRIVLVQGDYFWADKAERVGGTVTRMENARYTPCKPCEDNPDKAPAWSINAKSVEHDQEEHRVSYRDAWFEFFGVPVAYTPYFAHADGTVKQRSGLLSPTFSLDSDLGVGVETAYYWGAAADMDATIGLQAYSNETPVLLGEFRKRYADASITLNGSVTESGRTERSAGVDVDIDNEIRGHFQGIGLWDINDKWRAGFDVEVASDNQYLNQYNISDEDILESEASVERFDGRNYAAARSLFFQDLRIDRDVDQPNVIPELEVSFVQDAGDFLGGRLDADISFLGLRREGSDQDLNRLSLRTGWDRRFVSGYGLVSDFEAYVHGDAYNIRDIGLDNETKTEGRVYPVANLKTEYPIARSFDGYQVMLAPVAGVTLAPDLNESDEDDIPNEDSLDVKLDSTNLFEASRFPGLDRVEDDIKATYGLRAGVYGDGGSHTEVFIGQSYRLDDEDNPFESGSGLTRQRSDFVGSISADISSKYFLDYRFQMDGNSLESERHELSAAASFGKLGLSSQYFYDRSYSAAALTSPNDDGSREQLDSSLSYYIRPDLRFRVSGRYDLGEDQGLRKADFGLDYFGQCLSLSSTLSRNLTDDASGESSTEFTFSITLKNIGSFAGQ
jgi:LPS-assembly protein